MHALICGSFAFDNIMVFPDLFKNHILPDKVHMLNVSFMAPELRKEFGGCAGNIAYNLNLLGANVIPMGTVGHDFSPYADWMDEQGITRKHVREIKDQFTAQAFITTDLDDNQITAFHPGAMSYSHENRVDEADDVSLGIISPDGKQGMLEHADQFTEAGIPFIFDPGQGIPMFDAEELQSLICKATWMTVNDYEYQLIQNRAGLNPDQIVERVKFLVVTRGGKGSFIYRSGQCLVIPAAKTRQIVDPTGCGDAYRAGLIYGLMNDLDIETSGKIASLMGAIKIESNGTQNHSFEMQEFRDRFRENYGFDF